jgi:hypothetical protein
MDQQQSNAVVAAIVAEAQTAGGKLITCGSADLGIDDLRALTALLIHEVRELRKEARCGSQPPMSVGTNTGHTERM